MAFASNQTSNYGLCQWEQTDLVVHSDFNEDNQKIDSALHSLQTEVDSKADQSALDSLSTTVSGKASSSTVSSLSSRVSSLESGKASVSSVNSVAADLEDLTADCAMVVSGTYVGSGNNGALHPTTLNLTALNRTPLLVVVREKSNASHGLVLVNGMTQCAANVSGNMLNGSEVYITKWAKNQVSWYGESIWSQMNESGTTYCYFAVG